MNLVGPIALQAITIISIGISTTHTSLTITIFFQFISSLLVVENLRNKLKTMVNDIRAPHFKGIFIR